MYSKHNYSKILILSQRESRPKLNKNNLDLIKLKQNLFGYTEEDIKFLMKPMLENSAEATGSMGMTLQ